MGKTERFSLTFTVNNFSDVKKALLSPPVIAHNLQWRILIQPTYDEVDKKKSLGYYLHCDGFDGGSEASYYSCQATASARVIPVKQEADTVSKEISNTFKKNEWNKA